MSRARWWANTWRRAALMSPAITNHRWGLPHSFELYCLHICCGTEVSPVAQASITHMLTCRHTHTHTHPEPFSPDKWINRWTALLCMGWVLPFPHNGKEKVGATLNRVPLSPHSLLIWASYNTETDPWGSSLARPNFPWCFRLLFSCLLGWVLSGLIMTDKWHAASPTFPSLHVVLPP